MGNVLKSVLDKDPEKNIAAFGFFTNYQVKDYFIEGSSVLAFGESDHLWAHLVSSDRDELSILLEKHHKKTKCYFSVEDWMIPLILKYGTIDWKMTTNRFILEENVNIKPPKIKVEKLNKSYASYVYKHSDYRDFISVNYTAERLNNDISAGIIINNLLVAWGFTHDDGALGFLHVLDNYRGNGYGTDILLGLIQSRRETGRPVFGNIVPGNSASTYLVSKVGFELDRKTSWIKLV